MSKYTTELRHICETEAGLLEQAGYNSINNIIAEARPKIFSFDYPIFDSNYKAGLETKIIKHYYTREICAETYGRWKLFLEARMNEIMPYFNQLYESTLINFDIFEDVNYTRSGERTTDEDGTSSNHEVIDTDTTDAGTSATVSVTDQDTTGTSTTQAVKVLDQDTTGTSTTESEKVIDTDTTDTGLAWDKYSDTPQGAITNIDNDTYLTNARKNTVNNSGTVDTTETNESTTTDAGTLDSTENATSETNEAGTLDSTVNTNVNTTDAGTVDTDITSSGAHTRDVLEEYSELIKGKMPGKTYMQMIKEFRDNFLNIDLMLINSLSDLFMTIY